MKITSILVAVCGNGFGDRDHGGTSSSLGGPAPTTRPVGRVETGVSVSGGVKKNQKWSGKTCSDAMSRTYIHICVNLSPCRLAWYSRCRSSTRVSRSKDSLPHLTPRLPVSTSYTLGSPTHVRRVVTASGILPDPTTPTL